ncbi:MAG TPA: bifunctional adenosylcobinamide kinase/adenosylcobinamide-phosphate guanylyltransferase [Dehalococcoidia bacterium]|nr:bifunctional adenosylcobinamide kinase/adenosylcobinamide-phosphate guanylyltransferase [Dehalococcoidia bacterium]
MKKELILILGGAGSGKSTFAQQLAQQKAERVLFVATAEAKDSEMAMRVRRHRRRRPGQWRTVEEPLELARAIGEAASHQVVIVDCLTLWVSNLLQASEAHKPAEQEAAVLDAVRGLADAYEKGEATLIMVSNEVGMGLVPPYPLGRIYRDILGRVNQLLAAKASRVYLMVAGLAIELRSLGAKSVLDRA